MRHMAFGIEKPAHKPEEKNADLNEIHNNIIT